MWTLEHLYYFNISIYLFNTRYKLYKSHGVNVLVLEKKALLLHSDQELLELIRQDHYMAFEVLYLRYLPELFQYSSRINIDNTDLEDHIQEIFTSLWVRRKEVEIERIDAWLYVSLRNRLLKELRKERVKAQYMESLKDFFAPLYDSVTDQLNVAELEAFIEEQLVKLPKKMQEVFRLSREQMLTHKEIAETLSISENTVKKQINNVLKIFRNKIPREKAILIFVLHFFLK